MKLLSLRLGANERVNILPFTLHLQDNSVKLTAVTKFVLT